MVAGVDEHADRTAVEADPGERIVELVQQQRGADAELVHLVELLGDLALAAARGLPAAAVEGLRQLDLEHHGQLALVDHAARLVWVGDDLEEALAWAARLGVDVAL